MKLDPLVAVTFAGMGSSRRSKPPASSSKPSRSSTPIRKTRKDHPEGVWTLPPTLRLGEVDKTKYLAIGESDRMTLRFVKIEKKG